VTTSNENYRPKLAGFGLQAMEARPHAPANSIRSLVCGWLTVITKRQRRQGTRGSL